jgi:hypothetical protein
LVFGLAASVFAFACSGAPQKKGDNEGDIPSGNGDNSRPLDPPRNPDNVNDEGGAFDLGGRESDAGPMDPPNRDDDGGMPMPMADAGQNNTTCQGSVGAGDFKIVEIMIASASGSGDKGEWVEIQSTRDCTLNAKGLTITSPRGTGSDTVTITADTFIPKYTTFIVADSATSSINHGLPGNVFEWNNADVLKNDGDTITVKNGSVVVDTITYPQFTNLAIGKSVSFPWDCSWSDRSDWSRWSYSFATYGSIYKGTPNDDNYDVACY